MKPPAISATEPTRHLMSEEESGLNLAEKSQVQPGLCPPKISAVYSNLEMSFKAKSIPNRANRRMSQVLPMWKSIIKEHGIMEILRHDSKRGAYAFYVKIKGFEESNNIAVDADCVELDRKALDAYLKRIKADKTLHRKMLFLFRKFPHWFGMAKPAPIYEENRE